jgi:hypothetical protein
MIAKHNLSGIFRNFGETLSNIKYIFHFYLQLSSLQKLFSLLNISRDTHNKNGWVFKIVFKHVQFKYNVRIFNDLFAKFSDIKFYETYRQTDRHDLTNVRSFHSSHANNA